MIAILPDYLRVSIGHRILHLRTKTLHLRTKMLAVQRIHRQYASSLQEHFEYAMRERRAAGTEFPSNTYEDPCEVVASLDRLIAGALAGNEHSPAMSTI